MGSFTYTNQYFKYLRIASCAFVICCAFVLSVVGDVNANNTPASGPDLLHNSQLFEKKLEDKWGIELTALRMTAANRMIDFRYRVLDAEKAAPLFKRQTKPYLVHKASGKVLAVPNTAKIGSLRNTNMPKEGRIYWMFFGNQGLVKSGDLVSVVIGDFRAENLVID